jgi:hypothetical protein
MFCEVVIVGESETYIEGTPEPTPLYPLNILPFPSVFKNQLVCYFQPSGTLAPDLISVKTQNSKSAGDMETRKVRRIFIFTYYLLMIRTILQDMLTVGLRFSRLDVARLIDFICINILDPDIFSHLTVPLKKMSVYSV